MGSLTSSRPAPVQPTIISVPTPVYTSNTSTTSAPTTEQNEADAQEQATETRRASLLQRDRSRFGTILTGFRGLLSQNNNNDTQRKTLLSE